MAVVNSNDSFKDLLSTLHKNTKSLAGLGSIEAGKTVEITPGGLIYVSPGRTSTTLGTITQLAFQTFNKVIWQSETDIESVLGGIRRIMDNVAKNVETIADQIDDKTAGFVLEALGKLEKRMAQATLGLSNLKNMHVGKVEIESRILKEQIRLENVARLVDQIRKKWLALDKRNQTFEFYVDCFCKEFTLKRALTFVEQGREFMVKVKKNIHENIPKEQRKTTMITFVWFLMHKAIVEKSQGFCNGTFDLCDEGYKIFKFFQQTPGVYQRLSTHYKGRTETYHFGMDLPQDRENNIGLPADKATVVFAMIKDSYDRKDHIYLKPEAHGCDYVSLGGVPILPTIDALYHTHDLIYGKTLKPIVEKYSLHAIPTQKEHPNKLYVLQFINIVSQIEDTKGNGFALPRQAKEKYKFFGAAGMKDYLEKEQTYLVETLTKLRADFSRLPDDRVALARRKIEIMQELLRQTKAFIEMVYADNGKYATFRKGNEVCFDSDDMLK